MSRIRVVNPFPTSSGIDMKTLLFADSAASSRRLRLLPLTAACAAASLSIAASAETLRVEAPVVVTATRTEKPLAEAAGSISVVTSEAIEERAPSTFGEAILGIPNVSVSDFQDPKFTRISIRGSDANQITYVIDGVRQDNYAMPTAAITRSASSSSRIFSSRWKSAGAAAAPFTATAASAAFWP